MEIAPCNSHLVIFTQQISHYHAARYRAASQNFRRVTVFSTSNDADFSEFLSHEIDTAPYHTEAFYDGYGMYLSAVRSGELWARVQSRLDQITPDIVAVAGWSFGESLAGIDWAKRNGRVVIMMSESQARDSRRHGLRELLKKRIVSSCDAALVGGLPHVDYVVELGLPRSCVFMGYDAVDNDHFAKGADQARAEDCTLRAREGLPAQYLLALCRFIEKKNLPRLVIAFGKALERSGTGHHLVILGDGPVHAEVKAVINALGLCSRVHLPGFRNYDALPSYYGLADGFVHVATTEQWGLVVNEAAASGLPVVVSHPSGAASQLVNEGVNGWLVEPLDVDDMAKALAECMILSPQARKEMAAASQRIVAEWGCERFGSGLRQAAEKGLGRSGKRGLSFGDRLIFRTLSKRHINSVN